METVRQALGVLLTLDLVAGFLLLAAVWLVRRRSPHAGPSGPALLGAFGCLTACLLLVYTGLWMLARG